MTYIGPRELAELRKQPKPPFFPKHPQWSECMERFLDQIEARCDSKVSRNTYDGYLRWFFAETFTNHRKTPDDYTEADVLGFISQPTFGPNVKGTPPKGSTYNARLVRVKSFYTFAAHYRIPNGKNKDGGTKTRPILQAVDPTEHIKLAKTNVARKTMADDEINRFFAAIDTSTVQGARDKCIFLWYFWRGNRKNAIICLRYGDIEEVTFFDGGHMRKGWVYHFREKGAKIGTAEIPAPVIDALNVYLEISGRKASMRADTPLFTGTINCIQGSQLAPRSIDHRFRHYAKRAVINGNHSIHSFRHTAAKIRYEQDHDIVKLMRFLGHTDPKMTLAYLEGIVYESDTTAQQLYARYGQL